VLWLHTQTKEMVGVMASRANKGKEVATSSKGFKRLRKEVALSSLVPRAPPAGRFRAKVVESMGSNGSMPKKKQIHPNELDR
ncbi:hypothetical protein HAX54_023143, partial [Datura stramonium]|nr:hypothetical protein [Datura stramonium]